MEERVSTVGSGLLPEVLRVSISVLERELRILAAWTDCWSLKKEPSEALARRDKLSPLMCR